VGKISDEEPNFGRGALWWREVSVEITYLLNVFPKLSESFILNEINEVSKNGVTLRVLAISSNKDELLHDSYTSNRKVYYYERKQSRALDLLNRHGLIHLINSPILLNPRINLYCGLVAHQFTQISESFETNLIHSHFASNATLIEMSVSRNLKIPFTFTVHASDLYRGMETSSWLTKKRFLRKLCDNAAGIVAISKYNLNFLVSRVGVDLEKVQVIHCGVDPQVFNRITPYKPSKQILCVARLVEKKGIHYLIEALSHLKNRFEATLSIVGTGPDEGTLKQLANTLGVSNRINFLGDVTDAQLIALYENSSIFVLPCVVSSDGDRDGIPVALMEAMSMELPVVSTDVSGIPELVKD
jgi:glycosyltransferase involved in cell wall biosynthesis